MNNPIIIIGSGLAGYMLAKEFRKLDSSTPLTLVTASDGRFYSKPLLSTALSQKKEPEVLALSSAVEMAEELKATIKTHTEVTSINTQQNSIQLSNQEELNYSQLILACGAEVLHAPLQGDAVSAVYSVNDLEGYSRFRQALVGVKRVAIVGAGLVGCEFTHDLISAGFELHLIAPDQYPLQRLVPQNIGQCLAVAFEQAGVNLYLECSVSAINRHQDHYHLSLSDGRILAVDVVLSAVGLRPALSLAKAAGLETSRGIVVDRQLRTRVANIYALGDCAEVMGQNLLYVAPLLHGARVLAQVLAGQVAQVDYPPMPILVKTSCCPIVVQNPPVGLELEWQFSGETPNCRALAYVNNQLQGFVLSGLCVKERPNLLKELQQVLKSPS